MNLFSDLLPLPSPEQMRQWDQLAIDFGIPEAMLMENAATAIMDVLREKDFLRKRQRIWLFMGGGNNGGDAAAIARRLLEEGLIPLILHTASLESLKGAAAEHACLAKKDGARFIQLDTDKSSPEILRRLLDLSANGDCGKPALILDGLLGTGFRGCLRSGMEAVISAVNRLAEYLDCPVCAIDSPSGLDCITGQPSPIAIKASFTITLAAPKTGLVLPRAKEWTGRMYCRKIGMPVSPHYPADYYLLDAAWPFYQQKFLPGSYKNSYGHVYVLGGSRGLEGAPHLACLSALRSGAGLATVCAPGKILPAIKANQPEIMTLTASEDDAWPRKPQQKILDILKKASSLVVGPGMGRSQEAAAFLEAILTMPDRPPTVFDADSLMLLGENPTLLRHITDADIFTPHPGEAAALLQSSAKKVQADRPAALKKLVELAPAVMVLKGAATRIGQQGRPSLICPYDIPQMAVGGAGDVLAGCAGAFLAMAQDRGGNAITCASAAVITHILAGMICAERFSERGALAGDLLEAIPQTANFLKKIKQTRPDEGIVPWPAFTSGI